MFAAIGVCGDFTGGEGQMTEQELRDKLISVAPSAVYANESEIQAIVDLAKAYAEARQSKEIAELKAQIRNYELRIDSDAVELDKRYSERTELNAEIKRLRDGIQKGFEKLAEIPYCSVLRTIFDNANGVQNGLESLLSPAPVTETQNEDQYE